MTKILKNTALVLVVVLLVVAGAAHYWLGRTPAGIDKLENALATDDLVLIGHLDNAKVTQLLELAGGPEDPSPLPVPVFGIEASVLQKLYSGQADLQNNLHQALFALHAEKDQPPSLTLVMEGSFNWQAIESELDEAFEISAVENNLYQLTALPPEQTEPVCPGDAQQSAKAAPPVYALIEGNRLIVSASQKYPKQLVRRIAESAEPEMDLTRWQAFRTGRLLSVAAIMPQQASQSTTGIAGLLVQGAAKKNAEVSAIYSGLSVSYQHLGLELAADIQATETWAAGREAALNQGLQSMRTQSAAYSPTFAAMLDNIRASAKGESLLVEVGLSRDMLLKVQDMVQEVVASMFSFGRPKQQPGGQVAPPQEQIDDSPWDYANNLMLEQSLPFQPSGDAKPLLTRQGFAFDVDEMEIDQQTGLVSLSVIASKQVPEVEGTFWSNAGIQYEMTVGGVTDSNGNNLLRDELCAKDLSAFQEKNHVKAERFNQSNQHLKLSKTVRLSEGRKLSDIAAIKGVIEFAVPVQAQRLVMPAKAGEVVETDGIRVYINEVGAGRVTYQVSGDKDKLLDVRALNQQGQTLRSAGWFGGEHKVSKSFTGEPRQLELYLAQRSVSKRIAFELSGDDLLKNRAEIKLQQQRPNAGRQYSARQWRQLSAVNLNNFDTEKASKLFYSFEPLVGEKLQAPLILRLYHDAKSSWGGQPKLRVLMPLVPELAHNHSAVELVANNPLIEGKSAQVFKKIVPGFSTRNGVSSYVGNMDIDGVPYISVAETLDIGLEPKQKLDTLSGEVILRFPEQVRQERLAFPAFGETASHGDSQLALTKITTGFIPRIQLTYTGDESRLIEIAAVTESGELIYPAQMDKRDDKLVVQFDLRNDLVQLAVVTAQRQYLQRYPFTIKATYAE